MVKIQLLERRIVLPLGTIDDKNNRGFQLHQKLFAECYGFINGPCDFSEPIVQDRSMRIS